MTSPTHTPWRPALAALALATAMPLAAHADQQATVVRDAETGQLRAPTASEARALNAARVKSEGQAAASGTSIRKRTLPNGAISVDLDESTMIFSVARRNADGSISRVEVQGKEAADKASQSLANFAKPMTAAKTTREAGYELK